jgi:hypothetical protein
VPFETNSSNAQVHAIFAEAAFLAVRAIEAATELQRMPGMSAVAFAERWTFAATSATMPKLPTSIQSDKIARLRKRW